MFITFNSQPRFSADGGGGGYDSIPMEHLASLFNESPEPGENPAEEPVVEIDDQDSEVVEEEPEQEETGQEEVQDPEQEEGIEAQETPETLDFAPIKYKADGMEFEAKSLEEVQQKLSAGHNFTQKTQAHAREVEEFNRTKQEFDNLQTQLKPYKDAFDLFHTNPNLEKQFVDLINNYFTENGGVQEKQVAQNLQYDPFRDPRVMELQNQVNELSVLREQITAERQTQSIQAEWDKLVTTYPDAKDKLEEIAKHADSKKVNLDTAYRDLYFDKITSSIKEQTLQQASINNKKKQVARTQMPTKVSTNEAPQKPKSYKDVEALLAAEGIKFT